MAGHDLLTEPDAVRRNIGFLATTTGLYGRLTPGLSFGAPMDDDTSSDPTHRPERVG